MGRRTRCSGLAGYPLGARNQRRRDPRGALSRSRRPTSRPIVACWRFRPALAVRGHRTARFGLRLPHRICACLCGAPLGRPIAASAAIRPAYAGAVGDPGLSVPCDSSLGDRGRCA